MKIISKIASIIVVMILFVYILNSCKTSSRWVINIITSDEGTDKVEYVSVYSNGNIEKIDEFESDDIEIYTADSGCFESYASSQGVFNKLMKTLLIDSEGHIVNNNEMITEIFQLTENIKHDIWKLQIIVADDNYFVVVQLNVNWQSPCEFYEYDQTQKKLKLLYSFDGVDIIGISLTNDE